MVKKIKFNISNTGEVSLAVEGTSGAECDSLTQPFENRLGTLSNKTYTDAYYHETLKEESSVEAGSDSQ